MRETTLIVTDVDGLYVWASGGDDEGEYVGFGDVHGWEPVVGAWVRVTLDSGDYPVKAEYAPQDGIPFTIWP